jgi:hypothetical protein
MVSSIAMAVEPRPPLKGGVEHSEHERQREAYCERVLSSKQHIEQVLGAAEGGLDGRGARGLVFWKSRPGERIGHVFNARNDNGHIRFWDAQGPCDYSGMFGPGTEISFYRTN